MSTQFTAMNTITLADLTDDNASSGNSVLAVTQQLSISLGAVSDPTLRAHETSQELVFRPRPEKKNNENTS
ncbi:multidrug or homocysteine efflux system [Escherichia coli]|nr:multidrug or homocysteine efflux system [Escherichia coli]